MISFRRSNSKLLFATLMMALGTSLVAPLGASAAPAVSPAASGKLHRFDFRLEGASCARCIINIRAALRATQGVSRCEVALRKPYGGTVVYDSSKIDIKHITTIAVTADPKSTVSVEDGVDVPIAKVPTVIVPKYTSLQAAK